MRIILCLLALTTLPLQAQLTPLTRAIRLEKFEEAKKHITPELVNKMDQGQYHPLTYAAYTGNNDLIESLLKAGANPNVVEHNGKTALYVAANLANTEGLRLLHQHGAKRPPKTALSPAVAAVHSSSLASLKTLLELYPDIDLNRASQKESLLHMACVRGYDDIAKNLITKRVDVTTHDRSHRSALHLATANRECSPELVKILIRGGVSPFERCYGKHFAPRTPIDFAASRGSLDKIKAILNNSQSKSHADAIRNSIFIAAAHNHPHIVQYLSNHLGITLADIHAEIDRRKKQVSPKEDHDPIQPKSLKNLLPRKNNIASTLPVQSYSLAVVSPESLKNEAFLITQALSTINNITVLERDQIAKIIQDNSLSSFQAADSKTLHANIKLIPANSIILLAKKKLPLGAFVEITLLHTESGIVTARHAIPMDKFSNPTELKELSKQLAASVQKFKSISKHAIAISMIPMQPELISTETLAISHQINTLLPYYLEATKGCLHVTRKQLDYLETEKVIGAKGTYWSSAWVIDGGVSLSSKKLMTLTLRASHRDGSKTLSASYTSSSDKLQHCLKKTWDKLAQKINLSPPEKPLTQTTAEMRLIIKQAKRLSDANHPEDALNLIRSALVLGHYNREHLELFLFTALKALPATKRLSCGFILQHPEALEPEDKDTHTDHIQVYIEVCHRALDYAKFLKGQLNMTHRSVRGSGRSHMFNEIISTILEESTYYRRLIASSIHGDNTKNEIRALDIKISNLTYYYLRKIRNHKSEKSTLEALIEHNSIYYQQFHPDLISSILDRAATLMLNPNIADWRIQKILLTGFSQAIDHKLDTSPWKEAFEIMRQSKFRSVREYAFAGALLSSRSRADRIRILHGIFESYASSGISSDDRSSSFPPFKFLPHDLAKELAGSEYPVEHGIITQTKSSPPPVGGISGYLWDSPDKDSPTGEYQRSLGAYVWIKQIGTRNNAFWEHACPTYIEKADSVPAQHQLRPMDWKIIRSIAMKNTELSPAALGLLNKLADPPVTPIANDIQLSSPIVFPRIESSGDLGQISFITQSTIHNDTLWIPATYIPTKSLDSLKKHSQHVIHILSLKSNKIETIHLPHNSSDSYTSSPGFNLHTDPAYLKMLFMGNNYAYYITKYKTHARLFSIHLKTRKATEIKLPLPKIIAAPCNVSGDTLYLSIADNTQRTQTHAANMLISIEGNQISSILVSNRRNPPLTPLDRPGVMIDRIKNTKSGLKLISNNSRMGLGEASKVQMAEFNKEKNQWNVSSGINTWKKMTAEMNNHHLEFYITRHSFKAYNHDFYPINPILVMNDFQTSIDLSKDKNQVVGIWRRKFNTPGYSGTFLSQPVRVPPLSHDVFDRKIYSASKPYSPDDPTSDLYYRGRRFDCWWYSANDFIKKKKFSTHLIGRWKNYLLVGLHHNFSGFPAVWKIDINELNHLLTPKRPK
jgi:ankyrin repeat protein